MRTYQNTRTRELYEVEQHEDAPDYTHRVQSDGSFAIRSEFSLDQGADRIIRLDAFSTKVRLVERRSA